MSALGFRSWRDTPRWGTRAVARFAAVYLVLEFWRMNGAQLPLAHRVNQRVLREDGVAPAGDGAADAGVGMRCRSGACRSGWRACILIAAVADSAAPSSARDGAHVWPYNRMKSLEASAAFLVSAVVCASVYLPLLAPPLAVTAAAGIAAAARLGQLRDAGGTGLIAAALLGWHDAIAS